VEHNFKSEWTRYSKVLRQRNEALKNRSPEEKTWMEQLAPIGEKISLLRENYLNDLRKYIEVNQRYIMPGCRAYV
jgi:recombinational DNA repair ATPase RecF